MPSALLTEPFPQIFIISFLVPITRKARGSQYLTGMTLAELPNIGDGKPVKTIFRGMVSPTHLKTFNLELFLSKGNDGTKHIAKTEGKDIERQGNPSYLQTPNPDTISDAKNCLLTGAWYICALRVSACTY